MHNQITRFKFVAITALLHDLLQVISKLSKSFQAQSLDLSMIHPLVEATKSSLNDMQRVPSARLAEFLNLIDQQKLEDDGRVDIQYRDVAIKVTAAGYTAFFQTKQRFIEEVVDNIDDRFLADSMTVLDALGILNPQRCLEIQHSMAIKSYKCCWTTMERKEMAGMVQSLLLLMNKQLGLNGDNCAS